MAETIVGKMVEDGIKTQTTRLIDNLEQILKEAGLGLRGAERRDPVGE